MPPPEPPPARPPGLPPIVATPPRREPVFNLPLAVTLSIAALVAVHAGRLLLDGAADLVLLVDWAVVPARWSVALGAASPDQVMRALSHPGEPADPLLRAVARHVLAEGDARPWTAVTYALLHGSWTHLAFNAVWLAAFGTPLARRLGAARFFALGLAASIGGALLHAALFPLDATPMIGASAAVSGFMGAAAWFMFGPARRSRWGEPPQPHERLRESLAGLARNRRAVIFVAAWLVANYVFAALAQPLAIAEESIAWQAHVGGFLAGFALFPLLDPLPVHDPSRRG